jgi:hypothetical protein
MASAVLISIFYIVRLSLNISFNEKQSFSAKIKENWSKLDFSICLRTLFSFFFEKSEKSGRPFLAHKSAQKPFIFHFFIQNPVRTRFFNNNRKNYYNPPTLKYFHMVRTQVRTAILRRIYWCELIIANFFSTIKVISSR